MYKDRKESQTISTHPMKYKRSANFEPATTANHQINTRWQFRTNHVRMLYRQIQTELIVTVMVAAVVAAVFWHAAPSELLTVWAIAVICSVGIRSLFISGTGATGGHNDINVWGKSYILGTLASGVLWGGLGLISIRYGDTVQQLFTLIVLTCICLTAYLSMPSSPIIVSAFIFPALLPLTAWFYTQGGTVPLALATLSIIITAVMLSSSKMMHATLTKLFSLGSHNTELINKLVAAGKSSDNAKKIAEDMNAKLQKLMQERKQAESRTRASEQRLSSIFDSMQDIVYQTDIDGRILWITPSIEQLLGFTAKEVLNRDIQDLYTRTCDHDNLRHTLDANFGSLEHFETQFRHKDSSSIWISENSHYKYDNSGNITGIEGCIRDISALVFAKEALHQEKERAQVTLSSIGDGVITTDLNGDIDYMNAVAEHATGWKLQDARGKPMLKVFRLVEEKSLEAPPDTVRLCLEQGKGTTLAGSLLLLHRYRENRLSVEVNASPIRDSHADISGVVLVFHDVTELRGLAREMSYQAAHDPLTGLLNRREFENRVTCAIENARNEDIHHALCYLDLDNFKVVNDTCGHFAGDELLKQLTIKLRTELREADTLARLGGDEFGILLKGCSIAKAHELTEILRKIVEEFRFIWDDTAFRVGASIGLVAITRNSGSLSDILSAADSACYVAKDQGRNRVHVYQINDEAVSERHGQMQWVQRIQDVLDQDRFRLFFQPFEKICPEPEDKEKLHGEVLVRMLDEENNIVSPGSFIPAAERYQIMPAIDRHVVSSTLEILLHDRAHIDQYLSTCSINLSAQSLSDDRFTKFLVNEIRNSGVPPQLLCFEITETAVITNLGKASKFIATLRDMGCRFALDDFGVGLSSFGYLKSLTVDYLKLDGCFIKNVVGDTIDNAMVTAINQIGHTMNIKTIAEFVENEATLETVRNIGIDYAQGFIIAKPMPMELVVYGHPSAGNGAVNTGDSARLQTAPARS